MYASILLLFIQINFYSIKILSKISIEFSYLLVFSLGNNSFGQCGRQIVEDENYFASRKINEIKGIHEKVVNVMHDALIVINVRLLMNPIKCTDCLWTGSFTISNRKWARLFMWLGG